MVTTPVPGPVPVPVPDGVRAPEGGGRRLAWGVNPPPAAICGRGQSSLAIGHSLVTVRHDDRRSSVAPGTRKPNNELAPGGGERWIARGVNSPSAAICGRCHGGLREGGWLAYGHWLMRVSHDGQRPSVTPDLAFPQRQVSGTAIRCSELGQRPGQRPGQRAGAAVRFSDGGMVTSGSFERGG